MLVKKYAIIGGGPVGVGLGKCFKQANIDYDLYEKQGDFGGLWDINTASGRVYQTTHLISSKRNTEFSDYPMPRGCSHYPRHQLFLNYIRSVAKQFDVYNHTYFNQTITHLEEHGDNWILQTAEGMQEEYLGIIVASGRLTKPIMPDYPGEFTNKIIHSSDYKSPEIFKDKNVLIVGAGNSGCDIAVDAVFYGKRTYFSTRRGYHYMPKFIDGIPTQDWLMQISSQFKNTEDMWDYASKTFKLAGYYGPHYGLPDPDHKIYQAHPIINSMILHYIAQGDVITKPDVKFLENTAVNFVDGSKEDIDIIVYATGYSPEFLFLPQHYAHHRDLLNELFMYTFHKHYNNLLFAGLFNTASGLGNVVNTTGNLLSAYLIARKHNSQNYQLFNKIIKHKKLDLGQDIYINNYRHDFEIELWRFIKSANTLRLKLGEL